MKTDYASVFCRQGHSQHGKPRHVSRENRVIELQEAASARRPPECMDMDDRSSTGIVIYGPSIALLGNWRDRLSAIQTCAFLDIAGDGAEDARQDNEHPSLSKNTCYGQPPRPKDSYRSRRRRKSSAQDVTRMLPTHSDSDRPATLLNQNGGNSQ